MKKVITILLLLSSTVAWAQQDYPRDITLGWTNASEYVDNTPIEAGDLVSVRIECFRQNESVPTFSSVRSVTGVGASQVETFTGVIPAPGTYLCYGYSIAVGDNESDASLPASRKYIGKPKPVVFD